MLFATRKLAASLLFVLIVQSFSFCGEKDPGDRGQAIQQLNAFVKEQAATGKFSGVVLVAKSDKPVLSVAYGLADRKAEIPISMETKFNLGSMPKMFTAVAIAQLAEAGKLHYGDPILKYLPDYPDKALAAKVTIHQLLTHTAGFGNYFRPGFLEKRLSTVAGYLALVEEDAPEAEPGEFRYSNSGYVVLGAIVEAVAHQDFYDYVRDHIFRPAGMQDTAYPARDERVKNLATGYTSGQGFMIVRPGEKPISGNPSGAVIRRPSDGPPISKSNSAKTLQDTNDMLPYRGSPAGGAFSTAPDLLRFVEALENHKLVNSSSLEILQSGKVDTRPEGPRYGYAFYEWQVAGHRIVGHGGGAPGVNTMLQIYPAAGYTVIVLANLDPPAAEEIAAKAQDLLLSAPSAVNH